MYNFRARWYDAETGRWISKDPLGIAGGLNLYEAFGNNPVNFIDPSGEFATWIVVTAIILIIVEIILVLDVHDPESMGPAQENPRMPPRRRGCR